MKKILTLILLTALLALGFTGCGGGTPELSDDEAMQVLGYAASIANPLNPANGLMSASSSPSIRSLETYTVTYESTSEGSVTITYTLTDADSITGTVDYQGLVVNYNGKKYTRDGHYDLTMDFASSIDYESGLVSVDTVYRLTGTMDVSGAGTARIDYDLTYTADMQINMNTYVTSGTMTVTGTLGGTAVNGSYDITL